jgi:hypothetical protein
MAVVRRGTWWILVALVAGVLIGSAVMMYAGSQAFNPR